MELRVSGDGGTFGWRYGPNTYSGGMRYMNSQADPTADWFFQTHGFGAGNAKPRGGADDHREGFRRQSVWAPRVQAGSPWWCG